MYKYMKILLKARLKKNKRYPSLDIFINNPYEKCERSFITMASDKAVDLTPQLVWVITYRYSGAERGVPAGPGRGETGGAREGWRPRIMGVGKRFVSAAVIMQINTAGNLFKYRNKRSSRRRRRSQRRNLRFKPRECVGVRSFHGYRAVLSILYYLLLARKRLNTLHI